MAQRIQRPLTLKLHSLPSDEPGTARVAEPRQDVRASARAASDERLGCKHRVQISMKFQKFECVDLVFQC